MDYLERDIQYLGNFLYEALLINAMCEFFSTSVCSVISVVILTTTEITEHTERNTYDFHYLAYGSLSFNKRWRSQSEGCGNQKYVLDQQTGLVGVVDKAAIKWED